LRKEKREEKEGGVVSLIDSKRKGEREREGGSTLTIKHT